jgi:hypothetical protein
MSVAQYLAEYMGEQYLNAGERPQCGNCNGSALGSAGQYNGSKRFYCKRRNGLSVARGGICIDWTERVSCK